MFTIMSIFIIAIFFLVVKTICVFVKNKSRKTKIIYLTTTVIVLLSFTFLSGVLNEYIEDIAFTEFEENLEADDVFYKSMVIENRTYYIYAFNEEITIRMFYYENGIYKSTYLKRHFLVPEFSSNIEEDLEMKFISSGNKRRSLFNDNVIGDLILYTSNSTEFDFSIVDSSHNDLEFIEFNHRGINYRIWILPYVLENSNERVVILIDDVEYTLGNTAP